MKEFLKKYAGPLYKVLFHFRYNTRVGRVVFTTVIRALFLVRERINGPYFAFDVCGTMGLGAMLSHTILLLDRCDRKDLTPVIRFSNPLYGSQDAKKRDWFSQFFEVSQHPASKHAKWIFYSKIQSHSDYFADPQGKGLSIERAHELFTRYLTIKDLVYDEANTVFSASKQGKRLGVHFRGTDKVFEAPRVGWNIVSDLVANEIRRDSSITSIFATSDETAFIDFIKTIPFGIPIIAYDAKAASANGLAIHFSPGDPYVQALEALTIMVLLSRCDIVVRTPSHLSAWAKILNPALKTITMARPREEYVYFPESVLMTTEQAPRKSFSPSGGRSQTRS
jgi:hypothetical protein